MPRVGLLITSLLCAGAILAVGGVAQGCPQNPSCGCQKHQAPPDPAKTAEAPPPKKDAKQPEAACSCGGKCAQDMKKLEAPKSSKQGSLDDRLIRPHRGLDASAGILG